VCCRDSAAARTDVPDTEAAIVAPHSSAAVPSAAAASAIMPAPSIGGAEVVNAVMVATAASADDIADVMPRRTRAKAEDDSMRLQHSRMMAGEEAKSEAEMLYLCGSVQTAEGLFKKASSGLAKAADPIIHQLVLTYHKRCAAAGKVFDLSPSFAAEVAKDAHLHFAGDAPSWANSSKLLHAGLLFEEVVSPGGLPGKDLSDVLEANNLTLPQFLMGLKTNTQGTLESRQANMRSNLDMIAVLLKQDGSGKEVCTQRRGR
jgi:hypothetical protein